MNNTVDLTEDIVVDLTDEDPMTAPQLLVNLPQQPALHPVPQQLPKTYEIEALLLYNSLPELQHVIQHNIQNKEHMFFYMVDYKPEREERQQLQVLAFSLLSANSFHIGCISGPNKKYISKAYFSNKITRVTVRTLQDPNVTYRVQVWAKFERTDQSFYTR